MADDGNPQNSKGKGKGKVPDAKDIEALIRLLGHKEEQPKPEKSKEMSSYQFWQTQPVPSFDDAKQKVEEEGPIKPVDKDKVPKEPKSLPRDDFAWVTIDLTNKDELSEVYKLLSEHYVEDHEAMFRFKYSETFFNWALKAPGWRKDWHIGVRVQKPDGKLGSLVAFVSGIPIDFRVRGNKFKSAEVNYLCIHKQLRNKRLAPLLIAEITRRFFIEGIYQAIYTAGIVIPSPVATCRYYHRTLDVEKLVRVGFSHLPRGVTLQQQIAKYKLPNKTLTPGVRSMDEKDIPQVKDLLTRYLARYQMAQDFTDEEVDHWLIHTEGRKDPPNRVVWTYVVETDGKITDFFSFYRLESTVIKSEQPEVIKAAYLYYYATETAFSDDAEAYKKRLNELMKDLLIQAKRYKFDVVNGLTLLDNPLFLREQLYGPGDGQLHYYLYNYRASPIPGGVDDQIQLDTDNMGGVGMVML